MNSADGDYLPRHIPEWIYSIGGLTEAISPESIRDLDFDLIPRWIGGLMPERSYPGVFIGSSNGALVHLAAVLGIPWLPQTFLCPVRDALGDPDEKDRKLTRISQAQSASRSLAAEKRG